MNNWKCLTLKKNSDWSFEEQKSSMLEYFRIESLKKKPSHLSRNGAAEQRKVSKELNENWKETDIEVFMIIIYRRWGVRKGGGGPEDFVCVMINLPDPQAL